MTIFAQSESKVVPIRAAACPRQLAYMIVRAGTERIVVVDGRALHDGLAAAQDIRQLLKLLGDGLCREQQLVLVWPDEIPGEFSYEFLQFVAATGEILPLEEPEAAAAAALFAQISSFRRDGLAMGCTPVWQATNLSTGQAVTIRPKPRSGLCWVGFSASDYLQQALTAGRERHRLLIAGEALAFNLVLLDDLYIFVDAGDRALSRQMLRQLQQAARWIARKSSVELPMRAHLMVYSSVREQSITADYFNDMLEMKALPGFAALLLVNLLQQCCPPGKSVWQLQRPGQTAGLYVYLEQSQNSAFHLCGELQLCTQVLACGKIQLP